MLWFWTREADGLCAWGMAVAGRERGVQRRGPLESRGPMNLKV